MKTLIFNDDNLAEDKIQDTILKARAIIINDAQEVLLSHCAGFYLFPGGKLRKNESPTKGLLREVREETGIMLKESAMEPFLQINHIMKDYPKRGKDNLFSNRCNITDYYLVRGNMDIDKSKMNLTSYEKESNFETIKIKFNEILPLLSNNHNTDKRAKCYLREISAVIHELKNYI